jgi:protein-L-isoaspartate(D-aspartate) O-methyltransferase
MKAKTGFAQAREKMVIQQLRKRAIKDQRVLDAMLEVPRHNFVPSDRQHQAYADAPLPIGHDQTISQPYIVALMTELLTLNGSERVLEVGTGSGYQTAILAKLAREIFSIERVPELAQEARTQLEAIGCGDRVKIIIGDGSQGLPDAAPFDVILVTAAAPGVPEPLKVQLAEGGKLVIPAGNRDGQILEMWQKKRGRLKCRQVAPVAFVPLLGEFGWKE